MVKIRQATLKDKEFVRNLDRENMASIINKTGNKYYGHIFDSFNPKRCFIIENDGPVGFLYFYVLKNKLDIWSIQIKKQFQREGYGKKLMNYIIAFAEKKRLKKIILEAHKSNKKAINFYTKLGFRNLGEIRSKKDKIGFEFNLK